jgi:hypothetical protein
MERQSERIVMSSKRFVIVSFFVTLSLSALCQSSYDILKAVFGHVTAAGALNLLYAVSLGCFIVKYFIDDVVDDNAGLRERISRRSLASLIVAWMFFLFATLSAGSLSVSALFWLVGVVVVSLFLLKNQSTIPPKCFRRYLLENAALGLVLLVLSLPLVVPGMGKTIIQGSGVDCLALATIGAFVTMLCDGAPENRG